MTKVKLVLAISLAMSSTGLFAKEVVNGFTNDAGILEGQARTQAARLRDKLSTTNMELFYNTTEGFKDIFEVMGEETGFNGFIAQPITDYLVSSGFPNEAVRDGVEVAELAYNLLKIWKNFKKIHPEKDVFEISELPVAMKEMFKDHPDIAVTAAESFGLMEDDGSFTEQVKYSIAEYSTLALNIVSAIPDAILYASKNIIDNNGSALNIDRADARTRVQSFLDNDKAIQFISYGTGNNLTSRVMSDFSGNENLRVLSIATVSYTHLTLPTTPYV